MITNLPLLFNLSVGLFVWVECIVLPLSVHFISKIELIVVRN